MPQINVDPDLKLLSSYVVFNMLRPQTIAFLTLASFVLGTEMDDAKAPKTFYPLEPGKPGHFIFLTGPSGSGKSTIALELAKNFGYKYYEGDCFIFGRGSNPYIPISDGEAMETNVVRDVLK